MAERMSGGGERDREAALGKDYEEATRAGLSDISDVNVFGEAFKRALGSSEARRNLYKDLANDMLNGIPLSEVELLTLSYGIRFDDEAARPIELDTLIPQLTRQEAITPGSTQVEFIASRAEKETMFDTVEQIVPFLGGFGGGAKAAAGAAGKAGVRGHIAAHPYRFGASMGVAGSVLTAGLLVGQSIYGDDAYGATGGGPPTTPGVMGPQTTTDEIDGVISSEDVEDLSDEDLETLRAQGNIIVIDAATGREIPLSDYDANRLFGREDIGQPGAPSGPGSYMPGADMPTVTEAGVGSFSPALIQMATALGLSPTELASLQVDKDSGFGTINPLMFGEINLPLDTFPYGVDISTGEALRHPRHRRDLPAGLGMLPEEDKTRYEVEKAFVPPGGQINPRAFQTYQGQTLLELIAETADLYNIPVELLYGLINAESGFITNAMTPDGTRVGLAQIDLAEYEYLTPSQATNPRFAIGWAGRSLAAGKLQYGSMPASVASQMSHEDAEYLAKTGEFENQQSAQFVENVYGYAGASGVGQMRYEPGNLPPVRTKYVGGGRGSGPTIPPFQAPDPDALRQVSRLTREEALGRSPLDDEYTSDIAKLNEWYREKYNADVARLQGKSSTEVDPQAKYEEYIRGLGEFEFREESRETRNVMDFMGEIIRIMQGV